MATLSHQPRVRSAPDPAGMRSGADYLAEIANDGRKVFIDGECVADVTKHPAFSGAARTIAAIYDLMADPELRDEMTFRSPDSGRPVSRIWQLPTDREALSQRRRALTRIAELSLGFMGRSPDHVAGFFAGFAMRPDVFARGGAARADAMLAAYADLRDRHRYVSYTIVPPQIDRTRPAHQQNPKDLYAGVVRETDGGIIVKGAQMLGTGAVFSDYVLLSNIQPQKPGDENYAISVLVPCNARGVRIYSRRSYAAAANTVFDYPLASRFDETDSLLVYDDVFIPWEHVFVYRDLDICRAQWFEAPAHVMGNSQSQIRFATKLHFLLGLANRVTRMTGVAQQPLAQHQLGLMAAYAAMYDGLVEAAEACCEPVPGGYVAPGRQQIYANMVLQSEIYPKLLDMMRELTGGGMIQLPSAAGDFDSPEMGPDIRRYIQSPGVEAEDRVKLFKLAWDMVGSEFAGRHEQYEKFYAGAPAIVRMHMMRNYDFDYADALVTRALGGYDRNGIVL